MKRIIAFLLASISIFAFAGCKADTPDVVSDTSYATDDYEQADTPDLFSGIYYAVGDYEEFLTPYLQIDTEKNEFYLGVGLIYSYAERGTYEIVDGVLIATSQNTVFQFEIKGRKTLVLIDNGDNDYFKIPMDTHFKFSDNQ